MYLDQIIGFNVSLSVSTAYNLNGAAEGTIVMNWQHVQVHVSQIKEIQLDAVVVG